MFGVSYCYRVVSRAGSGKGGAHDRSSARYDRPPRPRRRDRRHLRHEQTRQEILRTAWQIARQDGLTALSLRALARAVGMEAQSLYTYFGSKHAVYDAMFAEGNRELLDRLAGEAWPAQPRAALRQLGRTFVAFSVEDQARHQLLFQNSIPDFAPSPDSYAIALEVFDLGRARLNAARHHRPGASRHVDRSIGGLAAQQLANDPGGDRWLSSWTKRSTCTLPTSSPVAVPRARVRAAPPSQRPADGSGL